MSGLDRWLSEATRHLAEGSAAQVRTEIQEHYESALDTAIADGATADEGEKLALNALGDAGIANREYRRVLLTSAEARILRKSAWEARAICSRSWLKRLLLALPMAAMAAATVLFFTGRTAAARDVLFVGLVIGSLLAAPLLPIYTPSRARAYRLVKWVVMVGVIVFAFGSDPLKWSWLLISCLWYPARIEWTRASIRRKLPMKSWPRHLYL
jgi:hypothetical protein